MTVSRCTRRLLTASVVAGSVLAPADLHGQTDELRLGSESAVVLSRVVQPGELRGVAFDAKTGDPIPYAQVRYGNSGVLTDSIGRFLLSGVSGDPGLVTAEFIGYDKNQLELQALEMPAGRIVLFAMLKSIHRGSCVDLRSFGVRVVVRDALTGRAPNGLVVLRVHQDTLKVWDFQTAAPDADWVDLFARLWPTGHGRPFRSDSPIDAEVAAPGYATWHRSEIRLTRGPCGGAVTARMPVWLLPTGAGGRVHLVPADTQ